MQAQPPEEAGVGGAVTVLGSADQVAAAGGLSGAVTLNRGGVDNHTASSATLVTAASRLTSQDMVGGNSHSPLVYPDWLGRDGNSASRCARAFRSQRASLVKPSRACITAIVRTSASLIRRDPDGRTGRDTTGEQRVDHRSSYTVQWQGCPDRRPRGPPGSTLDDNADSGQSCPQITCAHTDHTSHCPPWTWTYSSSRRA